MCPVFLDYHGTNNIFTKFVLSLLKYNNIEKYWIVKNMLFIKKAKALSIPNICTFANNNDYV